MSQRVAGRLRSVAESAEAIRGAVADLLAQELSPSTGHLVAILHGCLFAPWVLTFRFVNGVVDFSTAVAIGAVGWRWAFAPLAVGPAVGIASMVRLRGLPVASKLAGGRK